LIKFRKSIASVIAMMVVIGTILTSCTQKSVAEVDSENKIIKMPEANETVVETQQWENIQVGFENWHKPDEFAVDVQNGILGAGEKYNVNTILYDSANMDSSDNTGKMVSSGIKGAIEYYRDPISAKQSINVLKEAGIPVISIDYPVPGSVYIGVDNYEAGLIAGRWLGDYTVEKWAGNVDLVIIVYSPLEGEFIGQLFQGIEKGLKSRIEVPEEKIVRVDGEGRTDQTAQVMKSALSRFPDANRILIGVGNDACAKGALNALRDEGKTGEAVIVGQGMQETLRKMMMEGNTPIKAGVAYFPEKYGEISMQAIRDLIEGKEVPDAIYVDTALLTKENILEYYTQ